VQLLEARAHQTDLLRRLAGGGDDAHGDGQLHAVDEEDIAGALDVLEARRAVAPGGVDVVDVRVRRLSDMRIGGDDRICRHGHRT
jgi:hypothetical protein